MKAKKIEMLLISILLPLAVGMLSALLSGSSRGIYDQINKPALSPPAIVFPIVWTVLYILMGISAYRICSTNEEGTAAAMKLYYLQLGFNFFWSIIFFRFQWFLLAFIWIIALIILVIQMIRQFAKLDKPAAYLQIPYLLWLLFAAYLSFMVYTLNR